jgi:hypothetical protein
MASIFFIGVAVLNSSSGLAPHGDGGLYLPHLYTRWLLNKHAACHRRNFK